MHPGNVQTIPYLRFFSCSLLTQVIRQIGHRWHGTIQYVHSPNLINALLTRPFSGDEVRLACFLIPLPDA